MIARAGDHRRFARHHGVVAHAGHLRGAHGGAVKELAVGDSGRFGELRAGGAGTQRRDADSGALHFVGEGFGEREHEGFAGVIEGHERAGHEGRGGGHVEDPAAAAAHHFGQEQLGQMGQRHHIHLQQAGFPGPIGFRVRAAHAKAGVVDQQIDRRAAHLGKNLRRRRGVRQIGRQWASFHAILARQAGSQFGQTRRAAGHQHDIVSASRAELREFGPETGRGAGHQGRPLGHSIPSSSE